MYPGLSRRIYRLFYPFSLFFPSVKPSDHYTDDRDESEELNGEQLDQQVQKAHDQLLQLKRQQEQIEKQKRELEELSHRQEQLQQGRVEMIEKFTRVSVILERETFDAQKRVEQLHEIQDAFRQHYQVIESINPKTWDPADINRELNRALSAVDDARAEYSKTLPKIQPEAEAETFVSDEQSYSAQGGDYNFVYWLKAGVAFTLPLTILGALFLLLSLMR